MSFSTVWGDFAPAITRPAYGTVIEPSLSTRWVKVTRAPYSLENRPPWPASNSVMLSVSPTPTIWLGAGAGAAKRLEKAVTRYCERMSTARWVEIDQDIVLKRLLLGNDILRRRTRRRHRRAAGEKTGGRGDDRQAGHRAGPHQFLTNP
ncbi:hypothetical protein K6K41_11410 [Chenggangzhangella methanolivorans]|uniref:Uncharacterized protein n=1 Tax=Chenggangzhangella methanolivorans TaxID=1437009 RepID=A0A9E6RCX9_9HYPH|nr:hypothetical protein [Chenggangzhangella methanolivorans]QZO02579.1 hypothetical protein K6K41_11410 [Chenggangzhangella methanolivorans]